MSHYIFFALPISVRVRSALVGVVQNECTCLLVFSVSQLLLSRLLWVLDEASYRSWGSTVIQYAVKYLYHLLQELSQKKPKKQTADEKYQHICV